MTLVADDISVDLAGRTILRGVSLKVQQGEIVAVVGANGAGKSTLLRALAGLVSLRAGDVLLDDRPVADWDRNALGCRVAYLPQDRVVHWPMPVEAVVALGRLPHKSPAAAVGTAGWNAVASALTAMDILALRSRPVGELSGGERARVLVARALAQDAQFLIADEPTSGLDPAHALQLFAHFVRLAAEGRSVIVALHDLSLAARYCHRALLLRTGTVEAVGPPRDVLSPERLASAFGIRAVTATLEGIPVVLPIAPLT